MLRQRFGARARVVSVRQVEGKGLARFLQAPKLEVIAAVGDPPAPVPVNVGVAAVAPEPAPAQMRTVVTEMPRPQGAQPPQESHAPPQESSFSATSRLVRLLEAGGISKPSVPSLVMTAIFTKHWMCWHKMSAS